MNDLVPQSLRNGMERVQSFYEHVKDWDDFVKRFVLYGSGLASSTYDNILSAVKVFFDEFSRTQNREHLLLHPVEITPAHLELFFDWYTKDRTAKSASIKVIQLKGFFRKLSERFPFFESPFTGISDQLRRKLAGPRRGQTRRQFMTKKEIERLCTYLKEKRELRAYFAHCLIRTLFAHGFRIGELVQLRWSDLEEVRGEMVVHFIGKGNREDSQIMDRSVLEELKKLRKYSSYDGPYLFPPIPPRKYNRIKRVATKPDGENIRWLLSELEADVNEAKMFDWKVRMNPHSFRHALGTELSKNGYPVQVIAKILRHRDIQTTAEFYCNDDPLPPSTYLSR